MLRNLAAGFYNISLIHSMYLYVWALVSVYMCMYEHV